jgi:hypothetical protein
MEKGDAFDKSRVWVGRREDGIEDCGQVETVNGGGERGRY